MNLCNLLPHIFNYFIFPPKLHEYLEFRYYAYFFRFFDKFNLF